MPKVCPEGFSEGGQEGHPLKKHRIYWGNDGGRTRTRTWDPLIKSQLLYQLSYAPFRWDSPGKAGLIEPRPKGDKPLKSGPELPAKQGFSPPGVA